MKIITITITIIYLLFNYYSIMDLQKLIENYFRDCTANSTYDASKGICIHCKEEIVLKDCSLINDLQNKDKQGYTLICSQCSIDAIIPLYSGNVLQSDIYTQKELVDKLHYEMFKKI